MSFIDHYNNMSDMINESKTGEYTSLDVFGHDSEAYKNDELGPVNFWFTTQIDERLESTPYKIGLHNPLVVRNNDFDMNDLYFSTKCVGYATEHEYDSVVIETMTTDIVITIDFDMSRSINTYLMEAKPLAGKQIAPERRKELARQQANVRKPTANKPKPGAVKRPAKAPPQGIRVDVLLANTGKLSPDRVSRAMKGMRKQPPKLTSAKEVQDQRYFRAEYNFRSAGSKKTQMGYADISQNKVFCNELFCTCSDFFYRLYAPYVAAGLSTWNIPPKFKAKQRGNVVRAPHNHHWTVITNPQGKLFLCKHLWAFLAYYVAGDAGNTELTDEEIADVISQYFGDVDSDGEEEELASDFEKAFGKLHQGQKGQDILPSNPVAKKLQQKDPKRVFSKLGGDDAEIEDEIGAVVDKEIK